MLGRVPSKETYTQTQRNKHLLWLKIGYCAVRPYTVNSTFIIPVVIPLLIGGKVQPVSGRFFFLFRQRNTVCRTCSREDNAAPMAATIYDRLIIIIITEIFKVA